MTEGLDKKRLAKNSALLYVRMLFTMWLNLYATRLTLANLGVDDLGVYGVVGSIVSLTGVLGNGATNAIQRFITFELGKDRGNPNAVFCTSLNLIFGISILMLLLLEVGGLWMLFHKVQIPTDSIDAAFWVFQLSVFTCLINLVSIPYNALVIAHEKMSAFAGISILQVVLNCAAAYCLSLFSSERLVWYAIFMATVGFLVRMIYQVYCRRKFSESRYHFEVRKDLLKNLGKFAGVSTLSGVLQTVAGEGLVFVINMTLGVAVNAVYMIALQLKNSILSFAMNIYKAVSPQITKTYAAGDHEHHKALVYGGSRMAVYMLFLIFFPFMFNTEYIMHLWLGKVPPYTVEFAQATAVLAVTYAAFEPIRSAVLATNRITKFMLIPDSFYLLAVLPIGFFVGKYWMSPVVLIWSIVIIDALACVLRVYFAVKQTVLSANALIFSVLWPIMQVAIGMGLILYVSGLLFSACSIAGMLAFLGVSSASTIVLVLLIDKDLRDNAIAVVRKLRTV